MCVCVCERKREREMRIRKGSKWNTMHNNMRVLSSLSIPNLGVSYSVPYVYAKELDTSIGNCLN